MGIYIVPPLLEGYQIVRLLHSEVRKPGWYLEEWHNGYWRGIKGPYKQSQGAKAWLERKRFRDLMDARRRGDDVVWPHLLRDAEGQPL